MDISADAFEELMQRAIEAIPQAFREKLNNVAIVIQDEPTQAQRTQMRLSPRMTLFGLYEGVPQTERWNYGQVTPDKITIFQMPMTNAAATEDELFEIVKDTVWHEIAHHFGMDEDYVRHAEHERKKRKRGTLENNK